MKEKIKNTIIVTAPLLLGTIIGLLSNSKETFSNVNKPSFSPPSILFPIVWSILYLLMGVSCYLVYKSNNPEKRTALIIYAIQLIVNLFWSIIFFNLKMYFVAFIWIILLIILVAYMIVKFYNINKTAAYLQIPYLLWIMFASILNYSIYVLN